MKDVCTLVIYTERNVITYDVNCTVKGMAEVIADSVNQGEALMLDTVEETRLLIDTVNVVAVEIKSKIPPLLKIRFKKQNCEPVSFRTAWGSYRGGGKPGEECVISLVDKAKNNTEQSVDEKIKAELAKVKPIFKNISKDKKHLADRQMHQLAFLQVTLDRLVFEVNNSNILENFVHDNAMMLQRVY